MLCFMLPSPDKSTLELRLESSRSSTLSNISWMRILKFSPRKLAEIIYKYCQTHNIVFSSLKLDSNNGLKVLSISITLPFPAPQSLLTAPQICSYCTAFCSWTIHYPCTTTLCQEMKNTYRLPRDLKKFASAEYAYAMKIFIRKLLCTLHQADNFLFHIHHIT